MKSGVEAGEEEEVEGKSRKECGRGLDWRKEGGEEREEGLTKEEGGKEGGREKGGGR